MIDKEDLIKQASLAYEVFMDVLFPGWRFDPNSIDTPLRVAKMYVNELCNSLYTEQPKITAFDNVDKYDGIIFQGNISVKSICAHHHIPFFGKAHVGYIPDPQGKIVGLSKLNRIVDWVSRKPQIQENLTKQIHGYLNDIIVGNFGIAVVIECNHLCVSLRGVQNDSVMKTATLSGVFMDSKDNARQEFYSFISDLK